VATVPEIPVVQVSVRDDTGDPDAFAAGVQMWTPIEVPVGQRPSAIVFAVLGAVAGVAAMVLGAFAVYTAGTSSDDGGPTAASPKPRAAAASGVEARVLSLLAKPSTERVAFRGSVGRLVLAVGSGGRAAILVRGLPRPAAGGPYYAWVVHAGSAPARAARIVGSERAVFLSAPVRADDDVVVSTTRPATARPGRAGFIAVRG
jgi:hypothetical protein